MNFSHAEEHHSTAPQGTLCLLIGFGLAVIVLTGRMDADWGRLGRVVDRNPIVTWGISLGLMIGGAWLIKRTSSRETHWKPTIPGPRFQRSVLYTRLDCPLCDEALLTLDGYQPYLPGLILKEIDEDPELRDQYGNCVPVLELDGRIRFRGHINETLLRRLIDGTPPLTRRRKLQRRDGR